MAHFRSIKHAAKLLVIIDALQSLIWGLQKGELRSCVMSLLSWPHNLHHVRTLQSHPQLQFAKVWVSCSTHSSQANGLKDLLRSHLLLWSAMRSQKVGEINKNATGLQRGIGQRLTHFLRYVGCVCFQLNWVSISIIQYPQGQPFDLQYLRPPPKSKSLIGQSVA